MNGRIPLGKKDPANFYLYFGYFQNHHQGLGLALENCFIFLCIKVKKKNLKQGIAGLDCWIGQP